MKVLLGKYSGTSQAVFKSHHSNWFFCALSNNIFAKLPDGERNCSEEIMVRFVVQEKGSDIRYMILTA